MRRIDLTGPIYEGMWTYCPPIQEVRVRPTTTVASDGYSSHAVHMGDIQGTCIETAAHLYPDRPSIDEMPLDRFFVRAGVIQVPDKGPGEFITLTELEAAQVEIEPGMAALIATGWDRMWDTPRFYWDSPRFTREAAEWLVSRRPSLLGVDITSIDGTTSPLKLLHIIFGSGCLLLAPLVNLRLVQQKYVDLVVLPIRLRGTCGAPCRAVAIEP